MSHDLPDGKGEGGAAAATWVTPGPHAAARERW